MEAAAVSEGSSESNMFSNGPLSQPGVRWVVILLVKIPTMSDSLPSFLQVVVQNGKISALAFVGFYIALVLLWLPFWGLSFLITEYGVYALFVATVFFIGRAVIRMLAFPGSSSRLTSEIETEFARYSVRMLISASNSFYDLANSIQTVSNHGGGLDSPAGDVRSNRSVAYYEIPGLWKRAKQYRERVVAVYAEVLGYLYKQQDDDDSRRTTSDSTKYGNNKLSGDVGTLFSLTPQARSDGRELLSLLTKILGQIDALEQQASSLLITPTGGVKPKPLSEEAQATAQALAASANELKDFVTSLKPPDDNEGQDEGTADQEEDLTVDSLRRKLAEKQGSPIDAAKNAANSVLAMLDPPPHTSIFGFDVQRGCVIARYRGARQFWVQRPSGGRIDVLHIPSKDKGASLPRNKKAILYCNPNAGLIEVCTGMSLAGGNVSVDGDSYSGDGTWVDYYTDLGFDVYLFNYAGFGRSYGTSCCGSGREAVFVPGIFGRVRRIFGVCFCGFQPTTNTLRKDGVAVGRFLITEVGIDQLVIHGESIGGVAAAGTARTLTNSISTASKVALLICDRTFCNLEATAQRLIGGWSAYAIRMLAPFWNSDVAGDFIAAGSRKVVANDSADTIIADPSSLKSGIAFWKEIRGGSASTGCVGWMVETPLEYRMADWENVCVTESRYVRPSLIRAQPPIWPSDKHVTKEEAFHFAACARRIGKLASLERRKVAAAQAADGDVEMSVVDRASRPPIIAAWDLLGCCDGLCGAPLGVAVKRGFDGTVSWLCCTLTFGGQTLVDNATERTKSMGGNTEESPLEVTPFDFDNRPEGYEQQESDTTVYPKPIPEVVSQLKLFVSENGNDAIVSSVNHELVFVVGMLEYVAVRLSSPAVMSTSRRNREFQHQESDVGYFMDLHCGHNNAFSKEERKRLKNILEKVTNPQQSSRETS